MSAGAFWGVYYADFGYSYALPLSPSRPEWLSSGMFSVRLQLPLDAVGSGADDAGRRESARAQ